MAAQLLRDPADPQRARLEGVIDFHSVIALRAAGEQLLQSGEGAWCFDFSGIAQTNTAALSLLLCWRRAAAASGCQVRFVNLPAELHSMAAVSELEALLQ